jgi:hypothetical protein
VQKDEKLYGFLQENSFWKVEGTNYFKCDFPALSDSMGVGFYGIL